MTFQEKRVTPIYITVIWAMTQYRFVDECQRATYLQIFNLYACIKMSGDDSRRAV
jgi:hypothetical protein